MKQQKYSLSEKLKVAYEAGQRRTCREIEYKLGIPKSTVNRFLQIMKEEPKKWTKYDYINPLRYHFVAMHLLRNPLISNNTISLDSKKFEFSMSKSTVGRISKSLGFQSHYQQPKEKLNDKQKNYEVDFATRIRYSFYFQLPWCFSDESIICLEPYKRKVRYIRNIECDDQFIEKQGYPIKIMVWACIGKNFKSNLIRIEGCLNAISYQNMLAQNHIIEKLNDRYGTNGYVFQEDGATPHRAKSTRLYLKDKVTSLPEDLHWPSSSPDLSVIEICWAILKSRIDMSEVKTADDLYHAAENAWNTIPQETINLLIDSFDARLLSCISVGGNSLNGKKKLIKKYKVSIADGDNYIKMLIDEKTKTKEFIRMSSNFFRRLERLDMSQNQCNRQNCIDSSNIIKQLPERLKKKMNIPRPMFIEYSS